MSNVLPLTLKREYFNQILSSSFMKQLVSEGSDQFILAYTGE